MLKLTLMLLGIGAISALSVLGISALIDVGFATKIILFTMFVIVLGLVLIAFRAR